MSAWKVICATLVIFLAGLFTGALGVKALLGRPPSVQAPLPPQRLRVEMLGRMTRELQLSEAQRTRVDAILRESQERNREIMALVDPELRDEFRRTVRQLRDELTAEQRRKFDQLLQARNRRGDPGRQGEGAFSRPD
ncbi:MAG TPA: hypothetical protein VNO52_12960 [Methylomirabilota bacterium]|nr:hypothetical protein [Methylomirabilota bacterium]